MGAFHVIRAAPQTPESPSTRSGLLRKRYMPEYDRFRGGGSKKKSPQNHPNLGGMKSVYVSHVVRIEVLLSKRLVDAHGDVELEDDHANAEDMPEERQAVEPVRRQGVRLPSDSDEAGMGHSHAQVV
jgi:hypothetical protein